MIRSALAIGWLLLTVQSDEQSIRAARERSNAAIAQWRKINDRWLIQGELFVPTRCKGSRYCKQRPQ